MRLRRGWRVEVASQVETLLDLAAVRLWRCKGVANEVSRDPLASVSSAVAVSRLSGISLLGSKQGGGPMMWLHQGGLASFDLSPHLV